MDDGEDEDDEEEEDVSQTTWIICILDLSRVCRVLEQTFLFSDTIKHFRGDCAVGGLRRDLPQPDVPENLTCTNG